MAERQEAPGRLELVRGFVNTLDREEGRETLTDPDALRGWLTEAGLADTALSVRPADLRRAIAVREALRAVLLAHNGAAVVDDGSAATVDAAATLDAAAKRAHVRLHFDAACGPWLEPDAGGVDGALGRLLAIAHAAMAEGTWSRLKACREDSCEWAFYDATRNHSRTWCNMQVCGNRAKARAYRHRQQGSPAS
jgi:predicted RNA-binding Zn ribbon-like protein